MRPIGGQERRQAVVGLLGPAKRHLGVDGAHLRAARGVRVDLEGAEDEPSLRVDADVPAAQREAVLVQRLAGRAVDLVLRRLVVDDPVDLDEAGDADGGVRASPLFSSDALQLVDGCALRASSRGALERARPARRRRTAVASVSRDGGRRVLGAGARARASPRASAPRKRARAHRYGLRGSEPAVVVGSTTPVLVIAWRSCRR